MTPLLAHRLVWDRERSFESVYRKHVRDVYGFAYSILGNPADAEDVTQTTFLNAYRALNRGEKIENPRAWLLAIAHNVCRQRFRTTARRPQEVELDPEAAEAFHDEDAPTAGEIRTAMSQLGFNQRTVLVLREIEGFSYEEIGEAMGISLSAVETLLFRARQALREQLEAAENDLGCEAVERLISLQLDGKLSRPDRRLLRAHLRSCAECAKFARSQRARKKVMPSLVAVPLPAGLSGAFEAGTASVITAKAAALAIGAALVGTGALVSSGIIPLPGNGGETEAADSGVELDVRAAAFGTARLSLSREGRATVLPQRILIAQARRGLVVASAHETSQTQRGRKPKAADPDPKGGEREDPLVPIADVTDAVNDTVDGADDNIPKPPGSTDVEPPPLPRVPSPGGTGPLP